MARCDCRRDNRRSHLEGHQTKVLGPPGLQAACRRHEHLGHQLRVKLEILATYGTPHSSSLLTDVHNVLARHTNLSPFDGFHQLDGVDRIIDLVHDGLFVKPSCTDRH